MTDSVRKREDASWLEQTLRSSFTPLVFDVTDEQAVRAAVGEVSAGLNGRTLTALVNNAGQPQPST